MVKDLSSTLRSMFSRRDIRARPRTVLCRDRAREWVHIFAAGGAAWAAVPVPMSTTAGLVAAETHMIFWIARIYGEKLDGGEVAITASGLGFAGMGLKAAAIEACGLIPIAGWIVKSSIAAAAIEAIGALIIRHFEQKHPARVYGVTLGDRGRSGD